MELKKIIIIILTIISIIFLAVLDYLDITQFFDYSIHLDSTIANIITFMSILIGFISSIYVMIHQSQDSLVLKLLKENSLLSSFNYSFRSLMYVGFIDIISFISLNFFADSFKILKIILYITIPITIYFFLSAANFIITICKMVSAEEQLRRLDDKITKDDIIRR